MSIRVSAHTTADPERVWAVLSDLDAWPEWLPTVSTVERRDDAGPSPGPGAEYDVKQPRLPRARWVVTEWQPKAGFTWRSTSAGVTTVGTHRLRDRGASTEIELGIDWSGPLAPLARAVYGRMTRRYVETELESLLARVAQDRDGAPG